MLVVFLLLLDTKPAKHAHRPASINPRTPQTLGSRCVPVRSSVCAPPFFGFSFSSSLAAKFLKLVLTEYSALPWEETRCGYGCSDHASWNAHGYAAAFPFEAPFGSHSPYIHTVNDVLANMDHDYMGQFGKLAVAYVVELAKL